MEIIKSYLTKNKYSRPGTPLKSVSKIAIHYVGNAGSKAINNRNYFESLKSGKLDAKGNYIYASSHYIIGLNGEIIACVPEAEIAYCTNSANSYSISIEFCHPDTSGKPNSATYNALVELLTDLCTRYALTEQDIIRHYDITKKQCPIYYVENENAYKQLKNDVKKELEKTKVDQEYVDSVNILVKHKVIGSPDFWLDETSDKNQFYKGLIKNMAKKLK